MNIQPNTHIECLTAKCAGGLHLEAGDDHLECDTCGGRYPGALVNDESPRIWGRILTGNKDWVVAKDKDTQVVSWRLQKDIDGDEARAANQARIDAANEKAHAQKMKARAAREKAHAEAKAALNAPKKKAAAKK